MTLRLTEDETDALRSYAKDAGKSMQDVAREAIRQYLDDRASIRNAFLERIVREDAGLLERLSK